MAKRKNKPTVVHNIKSVNMEIDYNKLAKAIADTNRINDKKDDKVIDAFVNLSDRLLNICAIGCLVFGIYFFICVIVFFALNINSNSNTLFALVFLLIVVTFISSVFIVIAFRILKFSKIIKEVKCKELAVAIFGSIVSFLALIIATLAFVMGII